MSSIRLTKLCVNMIIVCTIDYFIQTYLLDNCLANSVYFKNLECGLSVAGGLVVSEALLDPEIPLP